MAQTLDNDSEAIMIRNLKFLQNKRSVALSKLDMRRTGIVLSQSNETGGHALLVHRARQQTCTVCTVHPQSCCDCGPGAKVLLW